jgi:hypothetical protein
MDDAKGEVAITQRRDREPAGRQRRIRLVVAGPTQGDQTIEIEVGATARALDHVVNIEASAAAARLAAPARAAAHLALDRLPFDPRGRRAAIHRRRIRPTSSEWASAERASALHCGLLWLLPMWAKSVIVLPFALNKRRRI